MSYCGLPNESVLAIGDISARWRFRMTNRTRLSRATIPNRGYNWWGVGKVEPGPKLFFLIPTRTQLSAYANHEFKIIPTPTQLSAYANHELKN